MKVFGTRTFALAAVPLALGTIGLVMPQRAHGIAAALVQVTNTAANPGVMQNMETTAPQQVELMVPGGNTIYPGTTVQMHRNTAAQGEAPNGYVVPEGQSLVITSMDVNTYYPGGAGMILLAGVAIGLEPMETVYAATQGFTEARFQSGLVFPTGSTVYVTNTTNVTGGNGGDVTVHGYLTAN
jgi:hypothetical protein